jgi:hypothetical protein
MIDNPIYGGAYAYGKTTASSGYSAKGVSMQIRRKARTDWLARISHISNHSERQNGLILSEGTVLRGATCAVEVHIS